jgi:hypothetical protein
MLMKLKSAIGDPATTTPNRHFPSLGRFAKQTKDIAGVHDA